MTHRSNFLACCVFIIFACTSTSSADNSTKAYSNEEVEEIIATMVSEIVLPNGFARDSTNQNTFAHYLRNLPLDTSDNLVNLYNGELKNNQSAQHAIIKLDVGEKDLQQCADAIMRLRAEYLYGQKKYDEISFQFTNGDWVDFKKYAYGNRPKINGNKVTWQKIASEDYSYSTFRKYMELIFMYAGTLSLSKQLNAVDNIQNIAIGDVFIIGGSPGHAVIVVDIAKHQTTKENIFMLAQSYMPAQEIHILKNPNNMDLSPWYKIPSNQRLITPEYSFQNSVLMRF